ncbi:MAG TPA: NlpC/P60 family protein [Chloroflexota bacterium]|nr:NlpC/P60 family protein [Chloroflexota bacterium]
MTRPTPAQLAFARSTLPQRRVASTSFSAQNSTQKTPFAQVLQNTAARPAATSVGRPTTRSSATTATYNAAMLPASFNFGGPAALSRSDILKNADQYMGVPYVWGGDSSAGLDCSAFVSKAWGISRHTTDNLSAVATPISKDQLQAGDALNLTTAHDSEGTGHVRLFDRWANAEHTKMYVYEETPPKSLHHVINWDPSYQPMRRMNLTDA